MVILYQANKKEGCLKISFTDFIGNLLL